jgi:integrase
MPKNLTLSRESKCPGVPPTRLFILQVSGRRIWRPYFASTPHLTFDQMVRRLPDFLKPFEFMKLNPRPTLWRPWQEDCFFTHNWNLTFIGLPKVNKRKQHCPTLTADEITHIVASAKGRYRVAAAPLAASNIRISELLGLRVEKHISDDRNRLFIRQQRRNGVVMSRTHSRRQQQTGTSTDTLRSPKCWTMI